jgi:hypothetical protein
LKIQFLGAAAALAEFRLLGVCHRPALEDTQGSGAVPNPEDREANDV